MKTHNELVMEFAKAWNNLDAGYIRDLLSDNFCYASQWVFDEIENREDYLEYFEGKLQTIKSSGSTVRADVGTLNNRYCLVINQILKGENKKATFLIETKDGYVQRADMCMVPPPESVRIVVDR